ncbi:hypothetical protein [Enterobacter cloacae]|uniref:hypothetical protein n=1 Tax=Enterobacter cloacae TaxID=550 RepID=UPI001D1FF9B6|nr:hypothetical protein [Enterobacter cloacae]CAF3126248.1 hypothetical protein AI2999V1_0102 [Enterobacter cloacae]CAH5426854.1 hypothetical protein AI2999V1_0102 [Enterobacter cloacae]
MEKLPNNASESTEGHIYQIYTALLYCKDLLKGESLYFEKYGDITISNNCQIEVKRYKEDLSDTHINIWKTIKNWLHSSFNPNIYKNLILLTTQQFSKTSTLNDWNSKTNVEKYQALEKIYELSKKRNKDTTLIDQPLTLKYMHDIFNENNESKLKTILTKFIILDRTPILEEQYNRLFYTCTPGIINSNKKIFINSLLGFIISPDTIGNKSGWCITYEQIEEQRTLLTSALCKDTSIFPKRHFDKKLDISSSDYKNHLFVKKIEDINYHDVIIQAKMDYIKTCNTICDEFKNGVNKTRFDFYQDDLINNFVIKHRFHKRNVKKDISIASLNFYDLITSEESNAIDGYQSTPRDFKNGIIHMHMDDEDKDLKWDLT